MGKRKSKATRVWKSKSSPAGHLHGNKSDEPNTSAISSHEVDGQMTILPDPNLSSTEDAKPGTTTVAVIYSAKRLFVMADGRARQPVPKVNGVEECVARTGSAPKVMCIAKKMVVTIAGKPKIGIDMVTRAEVAVKDYYGGKNGDVDDDVDDGGGNKRGRKKHGHKKKSVADDSGAYTVAKNNLIKSRKKWKVSNPDEEFPVELLLCGWHQGQFKITFIDHSETSTYTNFKEIVATGAGSGSICFKTHMHKYSTEDDPEKYLEELIALASITSRCTGGFITGAKLKRNKNENIKVSFFKRRHVLDLIAHHFSKLKGYMGTQLWFVAESMGYTVNDWVSLSIYMHKQFKNVIDVYEIGAQKEVNASVVGFVHFTSIDATMVAFESVGGDAIQLNLREDHSFRLSYFIPTEENLRQVCEELPILYY